MKSLSKFIIILLLASISSTKLNAQNAEIRTIDSLINQLKNKKFNSGFSYSIFKDLKIYDNQANFTAILKHLDSRRKDSIPMVRYVAYEFIFVYSRESKDAEFAKKAFSYLLQGCSDKNLLIAADNKTNICSYRSQFTQQIYADINIQKEIIELAKKDIVGYRDCIKSLVSQDKSLKIYLDFAKEYYTPLGGKYIVQKQNENNSSYYEKQNRNSYYYGVEWHVLITLGGMGDKDAIALIIKKIEDEKNIVTRYWQVGWASTAIGRREMANLFYKYYMDDRGLQKTPDEPERGGSIEYGDYLIYEYLEPQLLFLNPLSKEEETEVRGILNRKIDYINDREWNKRETDYILFFRKWLTKNKNNWKILNEK